MGVCSQQVLTDDLVDSFRATKHVVVPEAEDTIAFGFNQPRSLGIHLLVVLPAVTFDHQFRAMAGEVGEVMP